jgi:EAL domain-containing protein (putative c-di-GMP-specific phosphodiesterase class I)
VTIVLDDFGVDRSRLTLLTGSVCNAVKLDCSLIESVSEPGMQTLVRSLIGTAQSFALEIHAEGIERAEQAHFLMSHDCQKVQGFLFGRPMPKHDLAATIAKDMRNALPASGSIPATTAAA